jgi:hypothetical protein
MGADEPEFSGVSGRAIFVGSGSVKELRRALHDPKGIRAFLNTRRKTASAEEEAAIWRALFALYNIPEEWPRELRLEWLAGRLAAELFPRCQSLAKPRGPSKSHTAELRKRKESLFKKVEAFQRSCPVTSHKRMVDLFMQDAKNKKACKRAGFTSAKSLSQAIKEKRSGEAN